MPMLLNVNVPDVPYAELKGRRITHLGRRHRASPVIKTTSPRGEPLWWVGSVGAAAQAGEGTDFHAVAQGYVSITPLSVDLTAHAQLDKVSGWLRG